MSTTFQHMQQITWNQVGASIDMLANAIEACPDSLWAGEEKFWYIAYHTIFFHDYYLHEKPLEFHPPAPFTMSEMDPSGLMPPRTYTKQELLDYLAHVKKKTQDRIFNTTERSILAPVITYNKDHSLFETLLYNMRHVQHHTGQLNMMIRQHGGEPPKWVNRTEEQMNR